MRAGLDISDVEDHTKIRAKYLRALENEEWSLLPGTAYTKGFLHSYAELLGLDARLLVDEYKRQWEEPHELDISPVRPTIGPDVRDAGGGRRLGRWIAVLVTIVILALALVLVGHLFGSSAPKAPRGAAGSGLGTVTSGNNTARSGTSGALSSCTADASGRLPQGCVSLRIEPSAVLVACLVGDQQIRLDGLRLATATGVFHARRFELTLSASGTTSIAAVLVVDGHRTTVASPTGPVRYVITATRVRHAATPKSAGCSA
jgi:cytoskeleton protein RodZ